MTIRAVAFDLDDTLAVPARDRATILSEATERAGGGGLARLSRADYLEAHTANAAGETREPIFADLLDRVEAEADPSALAAAYREAIADAIAPVDGVEAMLASLSGTYPLGLLTDGPDRAQRHKLETLGWTDRFDAVVVTGSLATRKPDPDAYRRLCADLGVAPSAVAYVGDHVERDVVGARNAGLRPVQVLGPGAEPDPAAVAHVRRQDLAAELPGVLEALA